MLTSKTVSVEANRSSILGHANMGVRLMKGAKRVEAGILGLRSDVRKAQKFTSIGGKIG